MEMKNFSKYFQNKSFDEKLHEAESDQLKKTA